MYKLTINPFGGDPTCVIRLEDGALVPICDDNTDYQAYLAWVAEGNTPEGATE